MTPQDVLQLMQIVEDLRTRLQTMPALQPLVMDMITSPAAIASVMPARGGRRPMSATQRKRLSVMAKRRWATAKKAGNATLRGK